MKKGCKLFIFVLLVTLLCSTFVVSATENTDPVNLLPADVFSNPARAAEYFGRVSEDPAAYTKDGDDYVMNVPWFGNSWIYCNREVPYSSYTVKLEFAPIESVDNEGNPKYYGVGILLGYGGMSGMPWFNCKFNFNYDYETVEWFIWDHQGATQNYHGYGTVWYEEWEYPEDLWFELIIEVTPEETKIFLDGYEVPAFDDGYTPPDTGLDHYPTSQDINWLGFFSEGGDHSKGFNVKNMGIYEGVDLGLGRTDVEETPTDVPEETPVDIPTESSSAADTTGTPNAVDFEKQEDKNLVLPIVIAVVVVLALAVATVVIIKKKKK